MGNILLIHTISHGSFCLQATKMPFKIKALNDSVAEQEAFAFFEAVTEKFTAGKAFIWGPFFRNWETDRVIGMFNQNQSPLVSVPHRPRCNSPLQLVARVSLSSYECPNPRRPV